MTTWTLAARAAKMNPSAIREILKLTERPGTISLAGGLPSPQTFPIDAFTQACSAAAPSRCSTPPAKALPRCGSRWPTCCPGTWTRSRC